MQSGEMADRATAIVAAAVYHGSAASAAAARTLTDLVYRRLWQAGYSGAWEDFTRNPANDSLIRYLLQQAIGQDPDFRVRVDGLIRVAAGEPTRNYRQPGPGPADADGRPAGTPPFNGRSAPAQRSDQDDRTRHHRVTHRARRPGRTRVYVVLAGAVAILGLGALLVKGVATLVGPAHGASRASAGSQPPPAAAAVTFGALLTAPGQPGSASFSFGQPELITSPARMAQVTSANPAAVASCAPGRPGAYPRVIVEIFMRVSTASTVPEELGFNLTANDDTNYLLQYPGQPSCAPWPCFGSAIGKRRSSWRRHNMVTRWRGPPYFASSPAPITST